MFAHAFPVLMEAKKQLEVQTSSSRCWIIGAPTCFLLSTKGVKCGYVSGTVYTSVAAACARSLCTGMEWMLSSGDSLPFDCEQNNKTTITHDAVLNTD